jgi:hypothetical protein
MIINSKCKLFHTGNIQYAENVFCDIYYTIRLLIRSI